MLSDKTVPRLSIDPFSDGFLAGRTAATGYPDKLKADQALRRSLGPILAAWNPRARKHVGHGAATQRMVG